MTNIHDLSSRMVGCEGINAGKCNLNCAYCYIPKTKEMNALHEEIVEYIASGKFIDAAYEVIGEELEGYSFWGTEPTMALHHAIPWIPKLLETFPKLGKITFSTNMMTNVDSIIDLAKALSGDRKIILNVQYSLDGPAYITDETRHPKATKTIINNLHYLCTELNKIDFGEASIDLYAKSTWDKKIIRETANDISRVADFFRFLDEVYGSIADCITNPSVHHMPNSKPSLALPGYYTKEDGLNWSKILREVLRLEREHYVNNLYPNLDGPFDVYTARLFRILDYGAEFYSKAAMFSCSAGDTMVGLDHKGNLHPCHRSFYMSSDKYVESVKTQDPRQNWDVEHFKSDRIAHIRRTHITHKDDDFNRKRFLYTLAGFHHYTSMRVNTIRGALKLFAQEGEISKIYLKPGMNLLFAEFLVTAMCCNAEYLLLFGSDKLVPLGFLSMLGNGAFEQMVEHVGKGRYGRRHAEK